MTFTPDDYALILQKFSDLSDEQYRVFHASLVPGTTIHYGVRVPEIRRMAKEILRQDPTAFLGFSQPTSYEEIMLKGFVLAGMKMPIAEKLLLVEDFLPLIDNWAICDTFCSSLKCKPKEMPLVWEFIKPLFQSESEYTVRFAVVMFLGHFVQEFFVEEGLSLLLSISQDTYYINMAVAWAVSVCFIKFREPTFALISARQLRPFIQNKAIQKIRESLRVSAEDKTMLLAYKIL
ncbi:DNA alkylation repair protein [Scatolibacter rhodanostii]|uniref:DNA alkylation repair protein n=1 Tax=Scatolibacter rhodanostii TaxID=2014781 RepID=UPI000C077EA1|nr:DNA alkylation repair protein [Scatolibacter rhodanostii]